MKKAEAVQEPQLNALRKGKVPVSVFLVNGIKLDGFILSYDQFMILVGSQDGSSQIVMKHAISTISERRNNMHKSQQYR